MRIVVLRGTREPSRLVGQDGGSGTSDFSTYDTVAELQ